MPDLSELASRYVVQGDRLLVDGGHVTAIGDRLLADLPVGSRAARLLRRQRDVRVDALASDRIRLDFPSSALSLLLPLLRPRLAPRVPLCRRFPAEATR